MSEAPTRAEILRAIVDRHVVDAPDSLIVALLNVEPAGMGHNQPPATIDPENLIDYEGIPALLAANYAALATRRDELVALGVEWQNSHAGDRGPEISSDEDQASTTDIVAQLDTFIRNETGDVDAARRRVKRGPYEAGLRIDAFFKALSAPVGAIRAAMASAQDAYTRAKVAEARRIAAAEAQRRLEEEAEQRRLAQAAKPESSGLFDFDDAPPPAIAPILPATPAPLTSDIGTTTFARGTWKAELTDIKALAQAVIDGKAPASFLALNEPVVNASVRGKNGIRECPGLRIYQDIKTGRRS